MNSTVLKMSYLGVLLCTCRTVAETISIDSKEHFKHCLKSNSYRSASYKEQINDALISNVAVINLEQDLSGDNADIELLDDQTPASQQQVNPYTAPLLPALPSEVRVAEPFIEKTPAFTPTIASAKPSSDHQRSSTALSHGFFAMLSTHLKNGALYIQEKIMTTFTHS